MMQLMVCAVGPQSGQVHRASTPFGDRHSGRFQV
jgi:hypothetical protein